MAEYKTVAKKNEISSGTGTTVDVNGKELALFQIDGEFYAIDNTCPHAGGPLGDGELDGNVVTCPWHGAEFDCTTGEFLSPPAPSGVETYEVKVDGDDVNVKLED